MPKLSLLVACIVCALTPSLALAQQSVSSVLAGTGQGSGVIAQLDVADGTVLAAATPFGNFNGGIRVATGDINGDGTPDYIVGTGNGRGEIRVLDGTDLSLLWAFFPFGDKFKQGIYVAGGDINGDGRDDVIAGAGDGGEVRVFSGLNQQLLVTHTPFAGYDGGVTVASGDINGDGRDDLIAGMADGGTVRILSGVDGSQIALLFPYGSAFENGVNVAAGDVNDDGRSDLITGPRLNGDEVRVFSGIDMSLLVSFDAYSGSGNGPGITVAAGLVDADGHADIITGTGTGAQGRVRIFSGLNQTEISSFFAFSPNFHGGVFVAAIEGPATAPAFTSDAATTFQVGVAGSFEVTTSGGSGSTSITVTGTLPPNVTFTDNGDGTGTLAGTPAAGTGGTYPLTFTADDGTNPPVDQAFVLTVNDPPAITSADNHSVNAGSPLTFTVTTTGFPVPSISHSGDLPDGVTFTDNSDGTATIAGTPTEAGTFPIEITATNGLSPDAVQNFTLTVTCSTITVNGPTLADGFFGVAYGPFTFTQTGGAGTITWSASGLPAGLTIGSSSGTVSGTPTNTVLGAVVTITATDSAGCAGSTTRTINIRPTAANDSYIGGVGHTQFVVGDTIPTTPHVFVSDNVKNDDAGPGSLSVTFGPAANGTVVEGAADGTFTYTPNLNFAGPSDSFSYTLTDGNGITATATVTINLSGLVWYVNSAVAAGGDGRSHNPFNNFVSAGAASSSGSIIYVHSGVGTTNGVLTMDASQTLHGAGVTFTLNALTIPATGAPLASGTVHLGNNTVVIGMRFATGAQPSMNAVGLTQPVAIDQVQVIGGSIGLHLFNVTGSVTVTASTLSNTTTAGVRISGGTGAVNVGAVISNSAGRSVDVQNRTGGVVSFGGAINDASLGILLANNGGSTVSFAGGVTLDGSSATFSATGGGTLNVTGINSIGASTAPAGPALTVTGTTIGGAGVTFRHISSTGGARGIVLNNTGSGAFTVSGTGTAGSGGTIQNATGRGAEFISASGISLTHMNFSGNGTSVPSPNPACADGAASSTTGANTAADCESNIHLQSVSNVSLTGLSVTGSKQSGINGHDVTGITLTGLTVTGNGDAIGEDGLQIANLKGTNSIAASTFRDNAARSIDVHNNAAGSTTLNVNGGAFGNTDNPTALSTPSTATASDTILVATNGVNGASLTTVITGASFSNVFGRALHSNTEGNTSQSVTFGQAGVGNGNTVSNVTHGTDINGTTSGSVTYSVVNNTFTNTASAVTSGARTVINARKGFGATGNWSGVIDGNTIGTPGVALSGCDAVTCGGISTDNGAIVGNHDIVITNNAIYRVRGHGIFVANNPGVLSTGTLRTRIEANTLDDPDDGTAGPAGNLGSGIIVSTVGTGATVNVKAGGNTAAEKNSVTGNWGTGSGGTLRGVRFTRGTGSTICVSGHAGPFDSASVAAFITTQNTGNPGSATSGGAPGAFTGPVCPVP